MNLDQRFWAKVEKTEACWFWTAAIGDDGYGRFWAEGQMRRAHRVSYIAMVGSVPEGLVLDHLCRQRSCVRPDHLEPVTPLENSLRGIGPTLSTYQYVNVTSCPKGHPYDADNTYHRPDRPGRECRACQREACRRYNQRKKELA